MEKTSDRRTENALRRGRLMDQIRLSRETYVSEPVVLKLPAALIRRECLRLRLEYAGALSSGRAKEPAAEKSYQLRPGQRSQELFSADEVKPGYYHLIFSVGEGEERESRTLGCLLSWKRRLGQKDATAAERKKGVLDTLIESGQNTVFCAAALLEEGADAERAKQILSGELEGLRGGRSDSESVLAMILFLCYRYPGSLGAKLRAGAEEVALRADYRPVASESRTLLRYVCRFLAGMLFPGRLFADGKTMGAENCVEGRSLLLDWLQAFLKDYMSEWNSDVCMARTAHGLAIVYAVSNREDQLHGLAGQALDRLSRNLALYEHKGAFLPCTCGADMPSAVAFCGNETDELLYLLTGGGCLTGSGMGSAALALSDYEAPSPVPYRPERGLSLLFRNTQGKDPRVNLYLYKDRYALLSTAVGYRPGERGGPEQVAVAALGRTARVAVGHPGSGGGFWPGGGILPLAVQIRNLAIVSFCIPASDPKDYTHACVPLSEFRFYKGEGSALVLEKDGGYIGLKALGGLELQTAGPGANREFISRGRRNVWVLCVSGDSDYHHPEDFLEHMADIRILPDAQGGVSVLENGHRYTVQGDGTLLIDGTAAQLWPQTAEGTARTERVFGSANRRAGQEEKTAK